MGLARAGGVRRVGGGRWTWSGSGGGDSAGSVSGRGVRVGEEE